jgi:predicted NUDIX family phosphoesterase
MDELVLCAKSGEMFSGIMEAPLHINPHSICWVTRKHAEQDSSFQQLIPYVAIVCNNEVLQYERCGNEERLHKLYSIGLGGHIDYDPTKDVAKSSYDNKILNTTIFQSMDRELREEIHLSIYLSRFKHLGLIKISENPVNAVHTGILYKVDISEKEKESICFDEEISNYSFRSINEMIGELEKFETWSKYLLKVLQNLMIPERNRIKFENTI